MKSKMYTIYDSAAQAYNKPVYFINRGAAIRAFADEASDPKSNICRHANDYTLFEIGEFDELTGEVRPYETKIPCGMASELKKVQ
ncbi:MAG: hypothetical protein H7831_17870 [Magnetococcus sp. WYHC-3]